MAHGIHHVTCICGDAQQCVDFYTQTLGMRMIKKTINFDSPETYHLYFGDEIGSPGTAMTFFPFKGVPQGRPGAGQVFRTLFGASEDSKIYWKERLEAFGVEYQVDTDELHFSDPDGLNLGIVFGDYNAVPWSKSIVPEEHQLRGFARADLMIEQESGITEILTEKLGFEKNERGFGTDKEWVRIIEGERGVPGTGTVHHIAFRVADFKDQREHMMSIREVQHTTEIIDRQYFTSIYFRLKEGILFELATDGPGFLVDEDKETLGTHLKLPPWFEKQREEIEAALPELRYD